MTRTETQNDRSSDQDLNHDQDLVDGAGPADPAPSLRARTQDLGLTVLAGIGGLCLTVAALGLLFGVTPLVLTSGSMGPAIAPGALAFGRAVPADSVSVGDVVSTYNSSGVRVTHRVVETAAVGDGVTELILKGDANADPDAVPYRVREVDLVVTSVPVLGRAVHALNTPPVFFVVGMLCGSVLMAVFRPQQRSSPSNSTPAPNDASPGVMADDDATACTVDHDDARSEAAPAERELVSAATTEPRNR